MAPALIFGTRNTTQTNVLWHLGRRGGMQPIGDAGVCAAMTATWIKKSLRAGPDGLRSRRELGAKFLIGVVQGAYEMGSIPDGQGDRGMLESQNLVITNHQTGSHAQPIDITGRLSEVDGYAYLGVSGQGGGHAMGARIQPGGMDFFDPNEGLVRCGGLVEFRAFVINRLSEWYDDLLDGTWDIFEVSA